MSTPSRWSRLPAWVRRVPTFLAVGLTSTVAYGLMYLALRPLLGPQAANAVALVASTVMSTDGNRRFTFGVRRRATIAPHQLLGLAVLLVGLGITSGSLWLLGTVDPDAGRVTELVVLGFANGLVGVTRFVTFSVVMREEEPRATSARSAAAPVGSDGDEPGGRTWSAPT